MPSISAGLRSIDYGSENQVIADVITAIDGKPIVRSTDVSEVLRDYTSGDVVKVDLLRGGTKMTLPVTLEK